MNASSGRSFGKLVAMRTRAVWILRALWFLLPLTLGQAASDAIASADDAVPQVMTVGLWVLWALVVIATMLPVPITLTVTRLIAPGAVVLGGWTLLDTDASALSILATAHAIAVVVVAFNALVGDRFVDGGSYGDERRMLLRPPVPVAFLVAPALWSAMIASLASGPLLLGAEHYVLGSLLSAAAIFAWLVGGRALHQLARRWIVFVPNGFVLHDHMGITEPVLFRRTAVERLGAAIEGTPARDLSNKASGLLLECELTDPAPLGLRESAAVASLTDVRRFLFCPSLPGQLLDEAERRNFPVGG